MIEKQIEAQGRMVPALLRHGSQQFAGHHDGCLSPVFHNFGYRMRVPRAKLFDGNTSVGVDKRRHVTVILKGPSRRYFCDLCQSSAPFFQR